MSDVIALKRKSLKNSKTKRINRSKSGSFFLFLFLAACGIFTAIPIVYAFVTAFKPLDELWLFPPKLFWVSNPTMKNFSDLFVLMSNSQVPFARYIFNTLFITSAGTFFHIIFASMCAYPLATRKFPGSDFIFNIIVLSLMFNATVTAIPNYFIMSRLGWINTYASLIIPAIGSSLGLYLMKQFMSQLPAATLESAKIDGANEWMVFWQIVMPQVKPAWLTIMIFSIQNLWNLGANTYVYSEDLKTLSYALGQIVAGGIARAGVGAAVTVILMIVPMVIFVFSQSNIIETMTSSGIK